MANGDTDSGIRYVDDGGPDGATIAITSAKKVGFFGSAPVAKQTITGSRADDGATLQSLLTALASLGLITNSTTA